MAFWHHELIFLLEERSAKVMLEEGLLPKLLPDWLHYRCLSFEGKQDLEKQIPKKIRAWRNPKAYFIILRDQDRGDCRRVKERLKELCNEAGRPDALVRIACRELESWYLGDLRAVESALDSPGLASKQEKKRFRDPDNIQNAAAELMEITRYRYDKVGGSRSIGPELDLDENRSSSFRAFVEGIRRYLQRLESDSDNKF